MIWRLVKDLDEPKFWSYGHIKDPKIENEASKDIALSSWTKIAGRHEQVYPGGIWPLFSSTIISTTLLLITILRPRKISMKYSLTMNSTSSYFGKNELLIWERTTFIELEMEEFPDFLLQEPDKIKLVLFIVDKRWCCKYWFTNKDY
jgi:hypothetical protein